MRDPSWAVEPRGDGIVLKFRVHGSKFGPVHVEITGEALALAEAIEAAVEAMDEAELVTRRVSGAPSSGSCAKEQT
jgi:hypothetical protein